MNPQEKKLNRNRRHARVRARISGTSERPRIAVFKSNKHLYVQAIDDVAGTTLIGLSEMKLKKPAGKSGGTKTRLGQALGEALGAKMKELGIGKAVFDRGGFTYHGRIQAVAEGLRNAGIKV